MGLFGDFGKHSFRQSESGIQNARYPGIPLDPLVLENREKVRATRLEIEFPDSTGAFPPARNISENLADISYL